MDIAPLCLSCKKKRTEPDLDVLTCDAYPKEIPEKILHGDDCRFFVQDPKKPAPYGGPPKPRTKIGKRAWARGR